MGTEPNPVMAPESAIDEIREIYDRGQYLTAYEHGLRIAPLSRWRGTSARILASRLAGNLGSSRLADWHVIHAYRHDPGHADSLWYFANYLANVRGPLRAWWFLKNRDAPESASDESRSHWYSLKGRVLGSLRDFDAADEWLKRAEALGSFVWVDMERAAVLMFEDRHDEAEATIRETLTKRPYYRPAIQWLAHFLVQRERDDEALTVLRDASRRLESGALWLQLHNLLVELDQFDEAETALDEYERCSPLADPIVREWLAGRRGDLAYWRGDWSAAREHVAKSIEWNRAARRPLRQRDTPFLDQFQISLAQPRPESPSREWPVPFVRQHHQTCVPATLSAICRYWGKDVDHLAAADSITYKGTPHGKERRWANENGFATKEFTVTWDAARMLLDRGIPFTLTTSEVTSAHLQAVIGYDLVRKSFWIRDPGERHRREFFLETFFERYRSTGPRGMALVPSERAEELRSLELPDEALHDRLHRIEVALESHRRDDAEAELRVLESEHPDHLATWTGRRMIEMYDVDTPGLLAITEKMLTRFPEDMRLQLTRASLLREMGRRHDRLTLLKTLADSKTADPACWLQYAQELSDDAREHARARMYLGKAIRMNPGYAVNYAALARIVRDQRRLDEALELDRFALCLEDKDELLARTYFQSARALGKTDEAIAVLKRRFDRFGAKAMLPAQTLYFALIDLERIDEAMAVLHRALELRPTDGDLIAFIGESYLVRGDLAKAREYLERARGLCQPGLWLRYMASLARQENDLAGCLEFWRQVLAIEPLALDAHRGHAHTLAEIDGRAAAVEYLTRTCDRFPHNFPLAQLWFEWLREDTAAARETVLRRLIDIHPADGWTRREYAIHLADQNKMEEAFVQADLAAQLDPKNPGLWTTRFYLHSKVGDVEKAREDCRQAIRLSIDFEIAQHDLLSLCDTLAERREALKFIEGELIRQVTFGQGLLFFRDIAQGTLEHDELLSSLQAGLRARPDLWHAWSSVIRQLLTLERNIEALALAQRAIERFPHLPAIWIDLADAQRAVRDGDGELESLNRALAISPNFSAAQRALASFHERSGRLAEARAVYQSAINRAPLVAQNHLALAEFLSRHESKEAAWPIAAHALKIDPSAGAAWSRLLEWSMALNKTGDAIALARQETIDRPGEARAWLRLAQALGARPVDPDPAIDRKYVEETISAYDEVLKRNPRLIDAYDRKASLLADVSRWDDALAACRPTVLGDRPPVPLQGRAAWILARRGDLPAAAKAMRAVLADDPNYQWGWSNLADWLQSLGQWQEYLEAAENLIRIQPLDPVGRAYRGEAKIRLGRRDEGLADLREVCQNSPAYAFPAFYLFDEQFQAGEFDAARDALEHLKKHCPGDETTSRELRFAVHRQETNEALQILHRLGRASGENPGPLQNAVAYLESSGLATEVQKKLGELAADSRSHPYTAILFAERADINAPDFDDRLRFLDKAIARVGSKLRPLDLKADLLARAGRFGEALDVCNGPKSPEAVLPLRGRAAWIRFQRGQHDKAIDMMNKILNDDPAYYWGWSQLALWSESLGDFEQQMRAAEKMVEIAPNDWMAYIERSRANANIGQQTLSRLDYLTAIERNPRNTAGGCELISLYLTAGDIPGASRVLDLIAPFLDPETANKYRAAFEYLSLSWTQRLLRVATFRRPGLPDMGKWDPFGEYVAVAVIAVFVILVIGAIVVLSQKNRGPVGLATLAFFSMNGATLSFHSDSSPSNQNSPANLGDTWYDAEAQTDGL